MLGSSLVEKVYVCGRVPELTYVGYLVQNYETNEDYAAFYGVPYAKVPEGNERYQAPQTPEKRAKDKSQFYYTNVMKKRSAQVNGRQVMGWMDCLYMNIFLPREPESIKGLLPVLVFFHGGGFTSGNNHPGTYTPDSIIQHDVIFITVSYRLGLHGFLNMHTKDCPGNAGLKDQVRALEWIRDNIECFNGDPGNVTISGAGSGGTCVNLHLVSPMSKGLFHKAIIQSGGVYTPRGFRGHRRAMKEVLTNDWECNKFLFHIDKIGDTEYEYRRIHLRVREVLRADREIRHPYSISPLYGPTIETIKEGAFISTGLEEMMQAQVNPNIPIMAGITRDEGAYIFSVDERKKYETWISNHIPFVRFLMDNFRWSSDTALQHIDKIRDKYCPNVEKMTPVEQKRSFAKLIHDFHFHRFYDNFKFGPRRTLHKNLFVYEFGQFSDLCCVKREGLQELFPDVVTHGDELAYLYLSQPLRDKYKNIIEDGPEQQPEIELVTKHMCSLWANFCKDGVPKSDFAPDVEWRPHTEKDQCYLKIGKDLTMAGGSLCQSDWRWLNSLVRDKPVVESRPPTPT